MAYSRGALEEKTRSIVRVPKSRPPAASRLARSGVAAVLMTTVAGCLEPPITETVEIAFEGRDAVVVTTSVTLRNPADLRGAVAERVARVERELIDESDAWSRRIQPLEPESDRLTLERERGRVALAKREARLESRASLKEFFRADALSVRYDETPDWAEFSILPQGRGPATMQERRRVNAEMEVWIEEARPYFEAVGKLWEYVDDHPDRSRDCIGALFDAVPKGNLDDAEQALVQEVEERGGRVLGLFEIKEDQSDSLDERVRRVYDPFPAPIRVRVPGDPIEIEGFAAGSDGSFEIEALSLWNAFRSLEGRWIAPDPAVASWLHEQRPAGQEFDLDGFLARPRFAQRAPTAGALLREIEKALEPAPYYRVRWSVAAEGDDSGAPAGR